MIKDLLRLVSKNFKLIMRTKTSILVLILAPIIIVFLLGLAFNTTNVYNIKVGVYSSDYSDLAESLLGKLKEKEFTIVKYDAEKECVERIKVGDSNICVVFPPNMDIEKGKTNNIVFHVDPSETNLVWLILDIVSSEFTSKSEEISLDLTNILLDRLKSTKEQLAEKNDVLEKIIRDNEEMKNISIRISDKLNTLEFGTNDITLDELKDLEEESQKEMRAIRNNLMNEVDDSKEKIDLAQDKIEKIGNTSDLMYVDAKIKNVDSNLNDINNEANDIDKLNRSEWKQINTIIASLDEDIDDAMLKMTLADRAKNDMSSKNKDNIEILDENSVELGEMKVMFDNIQSGVESIKISEAGSIVNPITSTIKPIVEEKTHLNYIFSGIVIMIIMFVSILLASTVIVIEKKSKSYLINYLAPTKDITFVISMYLTIMMLMIMQIAVLMGISTYFYSSQILPNLGVISLILLLSTSLFVLIGMLIAYLFKAEQTITLVTVSVGSVFLFLSDIILPIESMPAAFQEIVKFNPFLLSETLLKKATLFGVGIGGIWQDLVLLAVLCVVVFIVILMVEQLLKRHSLFKIIRAIFPKKR